MQARKRNGVASPEAWRAAMAADRAERAEHLKLPSGAVILAVRPEPLEWILSGRIPQRLLGAALESGSGGEGGASRAMTREEILDLAQFARQLVRASVVEPPIGDAPGEIGMEEVPLEDRAFIFEWACRALGQAKGARRQTTEARSGESEGDPQTSYSSLPLSGLKERREENSSEKLERFREE